MSLIPRNLLRSGVSSRRALFRASTGTRGEAPRREARSPEKAGVGGSIPSLATTSLIPRYLLRSQRERRRALYRAGTGARGEAPRREARSPEKAGVGGSIPSLATTIRGPSTFEKL